MTGTELITKFELYIDDMTELSSTEELALLNKIYHKVCDDHAWEFLKSSHSGTTSTTVPYISLPADFGFLTQNHNYTDTTTFESQRPVVFVGTNYTPYEVVSWSDRRQYRNGGNYCWIDIANSRLYFATQPTSAESVEFDYIAIPDDLTTATSPLIPTRFQDILVHGMCIDDFIIQMSDKAKSYKQEHEIEYQKYLNAMKYWNSRLVQM